MPAEPRASSFQTMSELRQVLKSAGLAPRKKRGQHFLIDRNLMMKLVEAAELGPTDCVLEVGAGTGSLTALLAERAGRVVAVEIDEKLAMIADQCLAGFDNVTLVRCDALDRKSTVAAKVVEALRDSAAQTGGAVKLVANLPYDIATPLIVNLLLSDQPIARLCFTVQSEVADRFLAKAGSADYGPVSIVTQLLARGRRLCRAPPQAFWPIPKVNSTMVVLDRRLASQLAVADPSRFAEFVRAFFLHRRKTLTHSARRRPQGEALLGALSRLGIDSKARPEELSGRQWVDFFLMWDGFSTPSRIS